MIFTSSPQPAEESVELSVPDATDIPPAVPDLFATDPPSHPESGADSADAGAEQETLPQNTAEPADQEPERKPFVIELLRLDVAENGNFRPDSAVQLTKSLRTSGLLRILPAEDMKTLLWMLTFTTANGDCVPTVIELAQAMQVPEPKARQRLERLADYRWQGQPIAFFLPGEGGLDRYAPSPHIVAFVERPPTLAYSPTALLPALAGREAVLAYSRARYGRPRAEVEALIAQQMGWEEEAPPEDTTERAIWEVRQVLRAMGVTKEQADTLLTRFPLERIQRQLEWLPYRNAKNPLGFLLAAIEGDYEMPLALRQHASPSPTGERTQRASSEAVASPVSAPVAPLLSDTKAEEPMVNSL